MTTPTIQNKFNKWVDKIFTDETPPENVIGYFFLVNATNRQKYVTEIIGNSKIYEKQQGWLVTPPYHPKQTFTLCSFNDEVKPLDQLRTLIVNYMTTVNYKVSYLDKANGIVIGTLFSGLVKLK